MMKMFYKIWVDAIAFERARLPSNGKWKGFTMAYMTIMVGINIATVNGITHAFGFDISKLVEQWFSFFRTEDFKRIATSFIIMFLPAFLINYSLIFYNKRYERLILKYENKETKKGKPLFIYCLSSFLLLFVIGFINKLLR